MNKYKYILPFLLLLIIGVLGGCSGSKKSKKQNTSWIRFAWHDLTARDNGYFNARLKYNSNVKKLTTAASENYEQILPLYRIGQSQDAKALYSEMDEIIKKCSEVITYHEVSKWTDDSYLLIGKARHIKHDYTEAIKIFQYISTEFDKGIRNIEKKKPSKKKKKKRYKKKRGKKKKKPASKKASNNKEPYEKKFLRFLKHKPVRNEAILWLIRAYIDGENYNQSETLIKLLEEDEDFPEKWDDELAFLLAYHHLSQKSYSEAREPLIRGIKLTKKKKDKARYTYILAQLNQLQGNQYVALLNFQQVLRLKPDYRMEFYAKINLARSYEVDQGASSQEIKTILRRMSRNVKYEEFLDQIYYAMAEIEIKEGNTEQAIKFLKLSVASSTTNRKQKGLSFLKLGELYYDMEEYVQAQPYYDSTLTFYPRGNLEYRPIKIRNDILKDLVKQVRIIENEDSLQHIAKLSPNERERYIDNIIRKLRNQDEQEDDFGNTKPYQVDEQGSELGPIAGVQKTSWYFYNPSLTLRGTSEFKNRWGSRKLEDGWRRSDKRSLAEDEEPEDAASLIADFGFSREDFVNKLPLGEEKMAESNKRILLAYMSLANIYQVRIKNDRMALETLEAMLARFPESGFHAQALYNAHILYKRVFSMLKANSSKQKVLDQYPETIYAEILRDPNFLNKLADKDKQIKDHYEQTYKLYLANHHKEVLTRRKEATTLYPDNFLEPQYDLLEAYAIGQTTDRKGYQTALYAVVAKWPKHEVEKKANEILDYIDPKRKKRLEEAKIASTPATKYKKDEKEKHQFILIVKKQKGKVLEKIKKDLSDHNKKSHSLDKLKITNLLFQSDQQLLSVKTFPNAAKAMAYHKEIKKKKRFILKGLTEGKHFDYFVISNSNFSNFYRDKDINFYLSFFRDNYLK